MSGYKNQLLLRMTDADRNLLKADLEPVVLQLRQSIEAPGAPITHVFFPESGVISVVATAGNQRIEAGIIGREGVSGAALIQGADRSPNESYVQIEGVGHRIKAKAFRRALEQSHSLARLVLRYVHVFLLQVTHTALANGRATIEERLARWLLMAHDRQEDGDVKLTHELLALMLGVRRPGVTDALHALEGKRCIRASRGAILIEDRRALLAIAGSAYGAPEAEYARVFGKAPRAKPVRRRPID
jgi:CRP-like cAMP-binding protein